MKTLQSDLERGDATPSLAASASPFALDKGDKGAGIEFSMRRAFCMIC